MSPSVLDKLHFTEVGKAMLVTGLVMLVAAACLLFAAESRLRASNEAVQRTTSALLKIDEINDLVIGVDYSARGYALTGQMLFWEHEQQKQENLKHAVNDLLELVNPDQKAAVRALGRLSERHAAVYAALVAKGPNGLKDMAAAITDPDTRQKRYDVQVELSRLKTGELEALANQQADTESQLRRTSILTFIIVAIAFIGGMTDVMSRIWRSHYRRTHPDMIPASK